MQFVLYIASILGALSLYLMMPKRRWNLMIPGAILGAATLGGLWLVLSSVNLGGRQSIPGPWYWMAADHYRQWPVMAYYYVFSFIAIAAGVRVITHRRPTYSALWFVMLVLSSAGLLVVLSAAFMAFAMVIIYAGAILVTYLFVIMLATQTNDPEFRQESTPEYDRVAREPIAAAAAGFLLLAVLLSVTFRHETMTPNPSAAARSDAAILATTLANPANPAAAMRHVRPGTAGPAARAAPRNDPPSDARGASSASNADASVTNVQRIGLNLFEGHPLGLELAGVILLVSLVGAVLIATTNVQEEDSAGLHGRSGGPAPRAAPTPTLPTTTEHEHEPAPHEPQAIGASGGRTGV